MGITANGRQVILGIRPEDIYDETEFMNQTEKYEVNSRKSGNDRAETILCLYEQNETRMQ